MIVPPGSLLDPINQHPVLYLSAAYGAYTALEKLILRLLKGVVRLNAGICDCVTSCRAKWKAPKQEPLTIKKAARPAHLGTHSSTEPLQTG
jgi:hypothetical protein